MANQPDVLGECMALSAQTDDVHACLDNYLDVMDDNIGDITAFIRLELGGERRAAFERAQGAFETYRRENCLWYLAFSTPRREGELIAKNCLARMSIDRLAELQSLLAQGGTPGSSPAQAIDGFYVFGNDRNSFRPCGSERRYWVDGDDGALASLQQQYLERTSAELQVMFASVSGRLDDRASDRADHDGRLSIESVRELRVPSDADCRLPSGSPPVTQVDADDAGPAPSVEARVAPDASPVEAPAEPIVVARANPVADPDALPSPAPADTSAVAADGAAQGRLTAYFGAWLSDCDDRSQSAECRVQAGFDDGSSGGVTLALAGDGRTELIVRLPDGAATSADQVGFTIDGYRVGAIGGARLRRSDAGDELRVTERRFLERDLLPLLREGTALRIATDGDRAVRETTLIGLTRALAFAESYVDEAAPGAGTGSR